MTHFIVRASTACSSLLQHIVLQHFLNIPKGRVLRAFGKCRPFAGGQLSLKPVQQPVQHLDLPFIDRK